MKSSKISHEILSLLISVLGLFMLSCSQQNLKAPRHFSQERDYSKSLLTVEEAATQSIEVHSALFGNGLRSKSIPQISSVERIEPLLRSADKSIGGVYVINFKDNQGYVVLSENKYSSVPIVCACPTGNLDPNKPTENMNVIPVLMNTDALLVAHYDDDRKRQLPDTLFTDTDGNVYTWEDAMNKTRDVFGPWEIYSQEESLIQTHWYQSGNYSSYTPIIKGRHTPVGCAAVAVGQIMGFHNYPKFDWKLIIPDYNLEKEYCKSTIGTFLVDLGLPHNLNMNYALGGSGADISNVSRTFRNYNFSSGEPEDYRWSVLELEFKNRRPVFMSGYEYRHERKKPKFLIWGGGTEIFYTGGHAWVLDGIRVLRREVTAVRIMDSIPMYSYYQTRELVHCNFGWGGLSDGYYVSEAFDTSTDPVMRSSEDNEKVEIIQGRENYFNYNLKMITGISK